MKRICASVIIAAAMATGCSNPTAPSEPAGRACVQLDWYNEYAGAWDHTFKWAVGGVPTGAVVVANSLCDTRE